MGPLSLEGGELLRHRRTLARGRVLSKCGLRLLLALAGILPAGTADGASNKVRISDLSDIAFGPIGNLGADAIRSESLCLYANTDTNGYNITATGIGPGGSFVLTSGVQPLPFEVAWSSSAGQNSGTPVAPNVPLAGQVSTAANQSCTSGPATTASLVVILRAAALSNATAGTYTGTLTLVVGPE